MKGLSEKQQDAFLNSDARINILEGAVRSGKSFVCLLRWIDFCANGPAGPLVVCGRTDKTIKRNIIMPLQQLIGDALVYRAGKGEAYLYNRTMFIIGANDDRAETKIRGSEFAGALIDEATLIPENFFKMLLSRLSIPNACLFASTNPDSPFHWLRRDFLDRTDVLNIKSFQFSIRDNPSLSEKYIHDLSAEYKGLWHKRFIEGKWVLAEGAVYDFFDEEVHVIQQPDATANYYIIGVDYGTTNPCCFSLIGYNPSAYPNMWLEKEYYYDSRKEQKQKSDYDYTLDLIDFMDGYYVKNIYLDPSAASFKQELIRNGITNFSDGDNDVLSGIRYVSMLMTNGTFKVCMNCVNTIKEFSTYLWDAKASERGVDKPLKKHDHCFAAGSLVMTRKGNVSIECINIGDEVLTPIGYKKILHKFVHDEEVQTYNIFGKLITCTSSHKFYTANRGWIESKDMLCSDIILMLEEDNQCQKKKSFLTESHIVDTYMPNLPQVEGILHRLVQIKEKDMKVFTEKSGNITMGKFPKECIYITSTAIPSTMKLVTYVCSLQKSTLESITNFLRKNKKSLNENISITSDLLLKNGMPAKKVGLGIESMEINHSSIPKGKLNACSVPPSISQENSQAPNFVQINVKVSGEETITLTMSIEYVNSVIDNTQQINTVNPLHAQNHVEERCSGNVTQFLKNSLCTNVKIAEKSLKSSIMQKESSAHLPVRLNSVEKQKVYNIHVKDCQCYFVNNILTLNCMDSVRYALFTHFFKSGGKRMTEKDAEDYERMFLR